MSLNQATVLLKTKYASWIKDETIKAIVEQQKYELATLQNLMDAQTYAEFALHFNRLQPVFNDPLLRKFWENIQNNHQKVISKFLNSFFKIQLDFHFFSAFENAKPHNVKYCKKAINKGKEFIEALETQIKYFGPFIQSTHNEVITKVKEWVQGSEASLNTRQSSIEPSKYFPYTRKQKYKEALPIFFMRKLFIIFKDNFNRPMYEQISIIVNVIFETKYDKTDVAKLTNVVKGFPEQ